MDATIALAALTIAETRGIGVRPVPGGWIAIDASGGRLSGPGPATDPAAALLAADTRMQESEDRARTQDAERMMGVLERATAYPRPRIEQVDGESTTVWDLVSALDGEIVAAGLASAREALVQAAEQVTLETVETRRV